jgi:FeS assembly SUF system regulator
MIRISKLTDYAIIILSFLGKEPLILWQTSIIAEKNNLTKPTVAKLLKRLVKVKFVISYRGKDGGYKLAVEPHNLSLANIITALEGRVAITKCNSKVNSCLISKNCPLITPLTKINKLIYETLDTYKLSDLISTNITPTIDQTNITTIISSEQLNDHF